MRDASPQTRIQRDQAGECRRTNIMSLQSRDFESVLETLVRPNQQTIMGLETLVRIAGKQPILYGVIRSIRLWSKCVRSLL
jgi:hypothetical protein